MRARRLCASEASVCERGVCVRVRRLRASEASVCE